MGRGMRLGCAGPVGPGGPAGRPGCGVTWGIGPRWGARLRADGLATVRDLRAADPAILGRRYGVVVARIVRELRGIPCLALDEFAPPRQELQASRSFGRPVTALAELQAAVAHHVARAAAKLRGQGSQTQAVQVVLRPRRAGATTAPAPVAGWVRLAGPTADAARLTQAAVRAVAALHQPGRGYAGAGVRLLDLRRRRAARATGLRRATPTARRRGWRCWIRSTPAGAGGPCAWPARGSSSPGPCARTTARRPIPPAGTTCRWCGRGRRRVSPPGASPAPSGPAPRRRAGSPLRSPATAATARAGTEPAASAEPRVGDGRIEPAGLGHQVQDHRHPVVNGRDPRVGLGDQDRGGFQRLPVPLPALPQAGERQRLTVGRGDAVGLLAAAETVVGMGEASNIPLKAILEPRIRQDEFPVIGEILF